MAKIKGTRKRLLAKNPFCHYCRKRLGKSSSTLDHYIPKCDGGRGGANYRLCCKKCNNLKGCIHGKQWEKLVPMLIESGYLEMTKANRRQWRKDHIDLFKDFRYA